MLSTYLSTISLQNSSTPQTEKGTITPHLLEEKSLPAPTVSSKLHGVSIIITAHTAR